VMAVKGHRHCSLQYEIWNLYFPGTWTDTDCYYALDALFIRMTSW